MFSPGLTPAHHAFCKAYCQALGVPNRYYEEHAATGYHIQMPKVQWCRLDLENQVLGFKSVGVQTTKCSHTNFDPYPTFHGTAAPFQIAECGFMKAGHRQIGNKQGCYHCRDPRIAVLYAHPFTLAGYEFRVLYELFVHCSNTCGPKKKTKSRAWEYTRTDCCRTRISIRGIYIAEAWQLTEYTVL
jgi:hypothetical protein